ncbi:MAG TPA: hypothetical protein VHE12_03260 [bacterium]|nr:hypothetical protein [bacterium]
MADPKAGTNWRKDQVILVIRNIYHCNKVFPSYGYVERTYPELLDAAWVLFGPWENALVAAKIIFPAFDPDMFFDHELCIWAHDSLTDPIGRRTVL